MKVRSSLGWPAVLVLLVAATVAGCITRTATTVVYDDGETKIELRARTGIDRGFGHPLTVAPVRLAYILARIDVRKYDEDSQTRTPVIATDALFRIADGLAKALEEATPNQEIVVYTIERGSRFIVLQQKILTSFVAFVKDDRLHIHLSRVGWVIPPRRANDLPVPVVGELKGKFRVVPGDAMELVDRQSVAIDWRAPLFGKPTRTRIAPGGKLQRRTILMESGAVSAAPPPEPKAAIPADVSSDDLRALADLQDLRQRGEISEAEYKRRRLEILATEGAAP